MTLEERLQRYLGCQPDISRAAFIAPGAVVLGDVTLAEECSIWYGVVLRADINAIRIGRGTNLQDGTVVHLSDDFPTVLGDYVTVGHRAVIHACEIGNQTLIGMGATVADGAKIGDHCILGANSFVPKGFDLPAGHLAYGSPARVIRELTEEERGKLRAQADKYIRVAAAHRRLGFTQK